MVIRNSDTDEDPYRITLNGYGVEDDDSLNSSPNLQLKLDQ
jgi:hypothetical protein